MHINMERQRIMSITFSFLALMALMIVGLTIIFLVCTNYGVQEYNFHCSTKYKNPEKFPQLYYNVIHNQSYLQTTRLMFSLKLKENLDLGSKLIAASDTINDVGQLSIIKNYPFTVTIVTGRGMSRNVTFYKCFEPSIIFNELIQMNINPFLRGGFVTLLFKETNKNN